MNLPNSPAVTQDFMRERQGGRFHISLTLASMVLALMLYVAYSFGLLDAQSSLVFAILLGILFLPLVFVDPFHGVLVYVLIAPLSPEAQVADLPIRVQDPLIGIIFLGVILRQLKVGISGPRLKMAKTLILYGLTALLATSIALMVSPLSRPPNPLYVVKLFQMISLAFIVALSIRSIQHIQMLLVVMLLGLFIQGVWTNFGLSVRGDASRLTGRVISEQANVLGVYISIVIGIGLGYLDKSKHFFITTLLFIALGLIGYSVLATKSRTSYVSLAIMLGAAFFLMRRKWVPFLYGLMGLAVFIARGDFLTRLKSIGVVIGLNEDSSYQARVNALGVIWERISRTPSGVLFGSGRGSYPLAFADTQWGTELLYGGVVGLAVMVVLVLVVLYRAALFWKKNYKRDDAMGAAAIGIFLGLLVTSVSTFGLTSWSAIRTGEITFILIGLLMACLRLTEEEDKLSRGWKNPAFHITEKSEVLL